MAYKEKEIELIFNEIISDIESGMSLRSSLKKENRPTSKVFFKWVDNSESKRTQYARAMEIRAENIFEDILDIADEKSNDTISTEFGDKPNNEWINRSRLKIDARKWVLSRMIPKKYGDKISLEQEIKDITEIKLTDATGDTDT